MKNYLIFSVLVALLLTLSCGGGGDGGGSSSGGGSNSGANPSIANLEFSPNSAPQGEGGGAVTVMFTINFSDPDGNVSTLTFKSPAKTNTVPVNNVNGLKTGQLRITSTKDTSTKGIFPFEIWVTDSAGLDSNHLTGTFTVT